MVKAIVGSAWGDEGKGKITDRMAKEASMVIRFQGGANAGHTIINQYGRFALHQLPSGVFYDHTMNVIGPGVALNVNAIRNELASLAEQNVPAPNLIVSPRVQMVMPYHIDFDTFEEARLAGNSFGSTRSGIAPFYSDKFAKIGFQVAELYDEEALYAKLVRVLEVKNLLLRELYHKPEISADALMPTLLEWKKFLMPHVMDTTDLIHDKLKAGETILLEGQLGSLKDPDMGIYPFTTSSSTLAGYGTVGAGGIPPYEIKEIIAVVKAYSSAVGAGAFVSEIFGEEADEMRVRGGDKGEFGATTGRPRRMGWFDCVACRYGCRVQGATAVALTVMDALSYLKEIPVCVGYEIDGEITKSFPVTPLLNRAKPVLEVLPGWQTDIRGITDYDKLPAAAKNYIEFIERELEVPITMVSNGPKREDLILRK